MTDNQRAAFEAWYDTHDPCTPQSPFGRALACKAWQAALESPEVQALRDALERCRFALEPYDDIKPRNWVTDRENLRDAHQAARAALAAMEK